MIITTRLGIRKTPERLLRFRGRDENFSLLGVTFRVSRNNFDDVHHKTSVDAANEIIC